MKTLVLNQHNKCKDPYLKKENTYRSSSNEPARPKVSIEAYRFDIVLHSGI